MEQVFRSILVPVDGSAQSRTAQEMAVFVAKLFKSKVTLLHVVSKDLYLAGQTYTPRENYVPISTATGQFPRTLSLPKNRDNVLPDDITKEVIEEYRDMGQKILTQSTLLFSGKGIEVKEKLVERNNVFEEIVTEAEDGRYDLIIMGNCDGEDNEPDLHLGSVAKKVALSVKTSVLIVRMKKEIKKILVPIDGSAKEEKALQKAYAIAKAAGSKVVLLNVQEKSLLKLKPEINDISTQIVSRASTIFEGLQVEQRVSSGDPANVIIKTAEQTDVDLIVMRRGGLGTLKEIFLGSVSDHVLHHATVPVLLVK